MININTINSNGNFLITLRTPPILTLYENDLMGRAMVTYTTPETAEEMQERIAQEESYRAKYRAREDAAAKEEKDTFDNKIKQLSPDIQQRYQALYDELKEQQKKVNDVSLFGPIGAARDAKISAVSGAIRTLIGADGANQHTLLGNLRKGYDEGLFPSTTKKLVMATLNLVSPKDDVKSMLSFKITNHLLKIGSKLKDKDISQDNKDKLMAKKAVLEAAIKYLKSDCSPAEKAQFKKTIESNPRYGDALFRSEVKKLVDEARKIDGENNKPRMG